MMEKIILQPRSSYAHSEKGIKYGNIDLGRGHQ